MNKKIYFIFLIFLFSLYFIEFIYALPNDADNIINFNYQKSINYSLIPTVNNSNTLQGYNSSDFWKSYEDQIGLTGNKIGSFNFVTSGEATAGKLNVDNLYVDGDNITSITGTIKFGDENLVTTSGVRCNSITTNYFKENSGLLGLSFSLGSMSLSPNFDNFLNLGNSTNRFSQVYSLYYNGNGSKLTGVCLSNGTGCQTFSSMNYTNLALTNKSNTYDTGTTQYFKNINATNITSKSISLKNGSRSDKAISFIDNSNTGWYFEKETIWPYRWYLHFSYDNNSMLRFGENGMDGYQSMWNTGSEKFYSADFNNLMYLADKRFIVTTQGFNVSNTAVLFDSLYETATQNKIAPYTTANITINLTGKNFYTSGGSTYGGQGYFYLAFYGNIGTGLDNLNISGRVMNSDGVYTNPLSLKQINSGTKRIYALEFNQGAYLTKIEINITAGALDTQYGLVELEWKAKRPSGFDSMSGLEKYREQDLYKTWRWYNDSYIPLTNISKDGLSTTGSIKGQFKSLDGTTGVTRTLNLVNSSNNASCTVIFKNGLYTGGTC